MKYKYCFENYIMFDCVGLEKHLKAMAAKGWQLESIGRLLWKYRKEEPADLTYSVTYLPRASAYDPEITEEGEELKDFCAAAGWRKVAEWVQMQIFVTDRPDPTPIESDESIRLNIIRQTMKKNFLLSHGLLGVVMLLNLLLRLSSAFDYPLTYLADGSWFASILMFGFAALLMLIDVCYFLNWSRRAGKAVEQGRPLPEAKCYRWIAVGGWVILIALVLLLMMEEGFELFLLVYMVLMFLVIALVWGTNRQLRKRNASKGKNIAITLLVDVVLVLALTSFMIWFGINMGFGREEPADTLKIGNYNWRIFRHELPLRIEDIMDSDYDYYSCEKIEKETIFLRSEECWQSAPPDGEAHPELRYTVYTVKMDFLYDDVLRWVQEDEFRHYTAEGKDMSAFVPVDAASWGADAVYQLKIGEADASVMEDKYILCIGNKVVEFRPYFTLTEELKPKIIEQLR